MLPVEPEVRAIHPPAALPSQLRTDRSQPMCALSYIARRAGMEERSLPWLIGYVRQLIRDHGFPPPVAPRLWKGEMLIGHRAVSLHARWYRVAVDAWFDGLMPAPVAVIVDNAEIAAHADTLDARAALFCAPRRKAR